MIVLMRDGSIKLKSKVMVTPSHNIQGAHLNLLLRRSYFAAAACSMYVLGRKLEYYLRCSRYSKKCHCAEFSETDDDFSY